MSKYKRPTGTTNIDQLSQAFGKYWDKSEELKARHFLAERGMLNPRTLQAGLEGSKRVMSDRRKIQLKILRTLAAALEGESEATDLMCGEACATAPLLLTNRLQTLNLVDDGTSSIIYTVLQKLIQAFSLDRKAPLHNTRIDSSIQPNSIAATKHVILAETGISLPPELKQQRGTTLSAYQPQDPRFYRSAHILVRPPSLGEILQTLSGECERVLHLFDTPDFSAQSRQRIDRSRDHVEAIIADIPGWTIQSWQPLENNPENPTTYGVLNFR